jgi:ferredoxin
MAKDVYEELADALNGLPNGFPRTPSGIEIAILKRIFSKDEAFLAIQLSIAYEPINVIAERANLSVEDTTNRLTDMAKRGLLWHDTQEGASRFRLAPFVVGIYESHMRTLDHEFAHLVEEYMANGGAEGIMKPQPAIHRVIPTQSAVKTEWILPYDDIKAILQAHKTFRLRDCVCRVQQEFIGRRCNFPIRTCLSFSMYERPPRPDDISKEEALAYLDRFEEIGLVHTVSNVMHGFSYVCNCCGCCCNILRGITDYGIENSVAHSNYYSVIDKDECTGCGICIERCQVKAISEQDGIAVVDRKRCIGCGLCVSGCPTGAAKLHRKPKEEIVEPPFDYAAWERQRLNNRGLNK